jgi:hypothetical protein
MLLHSKKVEQELDFVSEEIKSKKYIDSFNVKRKKARFALISNRAMT